MATIRKRNDTGRWQAIVRLKGQQKSKAFTLKVDAERWAREQEIAIERGEPVRKASSVTLHDVVKAYANAVKLDPSRPVASSLKRLLEFFPPVPVQHLQQQDFLDFAKAREAAGAGPSTLMADFSYIRKQLSGARRHAGVDAAEALKALEDARATLKEGQRIRSSSERERRLHAGELEAIVHYMKPQLADLCLFAAVMGCRQAEILKLRWRDLDVKDRTITIHERKHPDPTKKKANRQVVPLVKGHFSFRGQVVDPLDILLRQPGRSNPDARIFAGVTAPMLRGTWQRMLRATGIKDLRFHDLRHEAISSLVELGLPLAQVQKVSGHRDLASLQRYAQIKAQNVHDMMEQLAAKKPAA